MSVTASARTPNSSRWRGEAGLAWRLQTCTERDVIESTEHVEPVAAAVQSTGDATATPPVVGQRQRGVDAALRLCEHVRIEGGGDADHGSPLIGLDGTGLMEMGERTDYLSLLSRYERHIVV